MPPNIGKLDFSLLPAEPTCEQQELASEITTTTSRPSHQQEEPLNHQPVDSTSYWNWPSSTTTTDTRFTERSASDLSRAKRLKPPPPQQASCAARQNPDNDDYWAEASASTTTCTSSTSTSNSSEDVNVKYFIDYSRLIGRGHKTIVRSCIERSTGKQFAIKSVNKMYTKQTREMKHEAAMLQQITCIMTTAATDDGAAADGHCPNTTSIIKLNDVLEDYHYFYMIMELCNGGELCDRVIEKATTLHNNSTKQQGHYAECDAVCIIRQVVQAVAFLHSNNIIHRDIKLENVLLSKDDDNDSTDIRLIDFGLSIHHNPELDPPLTDHVGSVYYVAPEVVNHCYTKTCDLWSIGVLTYALLSATSPFCGETDDERYEIIKSINNTNSSIVQFPSPDWDDITDMAKDFIRALLQPEPDLRPTAAELLQHEWLQQQQHYHHQQQEEEEDDAQSHHHRRNASSPSLVASDCNNSSSSKLKSSSSSRSSPRGMLLQRFKRAALHVMPLIKRHSTHSSHHGSYYE